MSDFHPHPFADPFRFHQRSAKRATIQQSFDAIRVSDTACSQHASHNCDAASIDHGDFVDRVGCFYREFCSGWHVVNGESALFFLLGQHFLNVWTQVVVVIHDYTL